MTRKNKLVTTIVTIALALLFVGGLAVAYFRATHPKDTRVKEYMMSLIIAIKGYKTQYFQLPEVATSDTTAIESKGVLLAIVTGDNATANPKQTRFWEPPPSRKDGSRGARKNAAGEWELRDYWGNLYHILLDANGDGKIPNPSKSDQEEDVLTADVIMYSAGADGDYATWQDNVKSWGP